MAHPQTARRFILPVILAAVFCLGTLRADAPLPLPGHKLKLDETVRHCSGAFVAIFERVVGPTGPGVYETRWKVKQVLRGDYASETTLPTEVQSSPKADAESMPTINKTYIAIESGPGYDKPQILIVLDNTDENLKKVSSLLKR
jgi:hypothetical protein